ncbi:MAG: phosphosulfolactate synthase [Flavobacteriales bacterium]|nr:MAG: phosphosulfolactate synthase [Flavobacteriales bacterium]MBE7441873.1 phosphosulfolactate synthase [Flavobacteriales bacterium]MBX2960805.1 phosphosulfolactate synthase [Flavobacteriales bacterium]MCL4856369.1 phosphosulfolactate synthase [Flavobacteriales bacterium]
MNFELPFIPKRDSQPRETGLTMMMDKGLSWREAENFVQSSAHLTDLVKLGFGTSYVSNDLAKKIAIYKEAGLKVYLGGTLFEAFIVRGMFDDYRKLLDKFQLNTCEVSDGSVVLNHEIKCEYISTLAKDFTVLSEVGSKEAGILISPSKWIKMMQNELQAGSWKVIAEARESGNVGIYRPNGTAHVALVNKIINNVKLENILWESPIKSQQVWFIKQFGANVNLGNIAPNEVIPLECLRLGLRGDTFFEHLPNEIIAEFK